MSDPFSFEFNFDNVDDALKTPQGEEAALVSSLEAAPEGSIIMQPAPEAPVEVVVPNTVAEVPKKISFYDRPEIKELMRQQSEAQRMIEEMRVINEEFTREWSEAKADREAFVKKINVELQAYQLRINEANRKREQAIQKVSQASETARRIQRELEDAREAERLAEEAAALEKRWQETVSAWDFMWVSFIKPFQLSCLRFVMEAWENDLHGVLIADQMGLGKTLEAAAAINLIQSHDEFETRIRMACARLPKESAGIKSVLWLCPSAVKTSTVTELRKWGHKGALALPAKGGQEARNGYVGVAHEFGFILVVGYEQLRNYAGKPATPALFEHDWPIVVLDEAHRFKTEGNSTFDGVERIVDTAGFIMPMTGTPLLNKPQDFWAILHMLTRRGKYAGKFESSYRFMNQYTSKWNGVVDFYGKDRLVREVNDMVIRRMRAEVMPELPPKVHTVRAVEFSQAQRDAYDQVRDRMYMEMNDDDVIPVTNFLTMLLRLRQIALWPHGVVIKRPDGTEARLECEDSAKFDEAMNIISELLENDEKVLVFSNFTEPIDEFVRRINAENFMYKGKKALAVAFHGETREDIKEVRKAAFNDPDDPVAVMVGNILAMGEGLNLHHGGCSNVVFLDQYWNPGKNEQAEDRIVRIGQTASSINVVILRGEQCVDHYIAKLLEDKEGMINGVINRKEFKKYMDEGLI